MIILVVVILLIGFIGFNVWKSQATTTAKVETTTLTAEEMKESVMTPGTLKLKKEQLVYFQPEKGEIAELFFKEGEKVNKGDKLLRYENKQLALEQKQNELQMRSNNLEYENIRKQHQQIDKELEKDPDNEQLKEEHDQINLQQQMAQIEIEQGIIQRESIERQEEDLIVRAETDGTVLAVHPHADAKVQMGEQAVMQIGTLEDVIVEGTVSEYDTLRIKKDQPVTLTSDAVPDEKWKGKVRLIGDLPVESTSLDGNDATVEYPVQINVTDKIKLKPGFKMLIEIMTDKTTVQTLPISAVKQDDDKNYVFIVEKGKAKQVEVKVGAVDSEKIEITDGITEEDEVIVDVTEELSNGMEVTMK